jgi:nitrate/TMAO reductase-like tetraheme cytochrome c subunit
MSLKKYWIIFNQYRIPALVSLYILIPIGCKSFDYLTKIENTFPAAKTCGDCHVDIFHEWSLSAHAQAFKSRDFLSNTNEGTFTDCLSCHSPEPKLTMQRPLPRNIFPEDGVTCTSCHLEKGKMFGPIRPTGAVHPHPIGIDKARFTDAAFCGRCHEGTYQQWQNSTINPKQTCQECHMPAVARKVTQAKDAVSGLIVSIEKKGTLRKHTFKIYPRPEGQEVFDLKTALDANNIIIELKNLLPHSFPTGNFGVQIGILRASFIDANNHELDMNEIEFVQELKTNLLSGQSKKWTFHIPPAAVKLKVLLFRRGRAGKNQVELLNREVPLS